MKVIVPGVECNPNPPDPLETLAVWAESRRAQKNGDYGYVLPLGRISWPTNFNCRKNNFTAADSRRQPLYRAPGIWIVAMRSYILVGLPDSSGDDFTQVTYGTRYI